MAELADIEAAIKVLEPHKYGTAIFHCCAIYPPEKSEVRLENIPFLIENTGLTVGFSDHTLGQETALEARSAGAVIFEKHVTLSRKNPGPDHPFAMEMDEFKQYVSSLKNAQVRQSSSENNTFHPLSEREAKKRPMYLKSIIARRDLPGGYVLNIDDVYLARPGTGLAPKYLSWAIGRPLARAIKAEMPLQHSDFGAG
jgi:sialic acid synthase SpsE